VTPERLLAAAGTEAEAGNWLTVHKTYDSNRFSSLNEINAGNVAGLHVADAVPAWAALNRLASARAGTWKARRWSTTASCMSRDPWGTPYKIDVSDGKQGKVIWVCDTGIDKDPEPRRASRSTVVSRFPATSSSPR
jgi:alcohol dehydrogenase (cytochrome c)